MKNAVRTRMTHRATVERNTQADPNPDGHLGPAEWEALDDALACFLHYRPASLARRESAQVARTAVVEEAVLLAPIGADVTEADRINGVEDRAGNVLLAGIANIRSVLPIRRSHVEITLEVVG